MADQTSSHLFATLFLLTFTSIFLSIKRRRDYPSTCGLEKGATSSQWHQPQDPIDIITFLLLPMPPFRWCPLVTLVEAACHLHKALAVIHVPLGNHLPHTESLVYWLYVWSGVKDQRGGIWKRHIPAFKHQQTRDRVGARTLTHEELMLLREQCRVWVSGFKPKYFTI